MVVTRFLRGKDFIDCQEWSKEELETVLQVAGDLKRKFAIGEPHELLRGKTLFMIFYNPSTRTRNSFEAGMTQLGGHAHFMPPESSWLKAESIKDTAEVLGRYGHAIAIRYLRWELPFAETNRILRLYAHHAPVPLINMEDGLYHPCQGMADLMAIREKFGENLKGKKFALSWAYSSYFGGYTGSECHTNIALMTRFGMDITLAYPKGFEVHQDMVNVARKNAEEAGVNFEITSSMKEAAKDAHVIYPVSWLPYSLLEGTEKDMERRKKIIMENTEKNRDWICNDEVMKAAHKKAVFMHCMPFARGEEVSASVADGPQSIIFDEAENRLHVQKAILSLVMGGL